VSLRESRTRIVMGLVMALIAAGVLLADGPLASWLDRPFYPCLFVGVFLLTLLGCVEMRALLKPLGPPLWLLIGSAITVFLANWPSHLRWVQGDPFRQVAYAFTLWVLIAFLFEMATYRPAGNSVVRCALFVWSLAYVGLLPAFLVQLRFSPSEDVRGAAALGVLIAVTKGGDIGAYFTGRFLGRHPMTPLLSPKKTWEGFVGGLAASVGVAVAIHQLKEGLFATMGEAAAFGLVIGVVGVLGDLAESMVKRDCGAKDASNVVPGFGGILDVVDSIIFAAPVAYWWLVRQ
jgi:phosphatidate cytidylyltransferase